MLKIENDFTTIEMAFIDVLNVYLTNKYGADGVINDRGEFVRYEADFKNSKQYEKFILQFEVRDTFVYISNIMIPASYRRQRISTKIIALMSCVALEHGISFYITQIVNDGWKDFLIRMGGEEDEDGDVRIRNKMWMKNLHL